jgi:hypothetical protein
LYVPAIVTVVAALTVCVVTVKVALDGKKIYVSTGRGHVSIRRCRG